MRAGQVLIGFLEPYTAHAAVRELTDRKVASFAMELVPRITRAQSMDALSSMATVAGYQAELMAAYLIRSSAQLTMGFQPSWNRICAQGRGSETGPG